MLYEADLSKAVLRDANLGGTNFYGATLDCANLNGAEYDEKTTWPDDFRVEESGARKLPSTDCSKEKSTYRVCPLCDSARSGALSRYCASWLGKRTPRMQHSGGLCF